MSSYTSSPAQAVEPAQASEAVAWHMGSTRAWLVFGLSVFLVSVPVFIQAPLVRLLPWLSLLATGGWLALGCWLLSRPATRIWGDVVLGFTLSWLAGSLYWGWLRWEPLLHLPVEALGLPFVLWGFKYNWYKVGNFFYLGSLLGTAITDLYFYLVDLIPHWRQLMQVDATLAMPIFQEAIVQVQTPWGIGWAAALAVFLLITGLLPMTLPGVRQARYHSLHWWAFSGAVFSTILVD
ncbi:MAG TPA: DUF3120 domain-containing protein, partial [Candidatus Caenarcaniphilales bacterium]